LPIIKDNLQKKTRKINVIKQIFTKPFLKTHEKLLQNKISQTLLKKSQKNFTKQSFTRANWTTLPLTTTHTKFAKKQRWNHIKICSKNL